MRILMVYWNRKSYDGSWVLSSSAAPAQIHPRLFYLDFEILQKKIERIQTVEV